MSTKIIRNDIPRDDSYGDGLFGSMLPPSDSQMGLFPKYTYEKVKSSIETDKKPWIKDNKLAVKNFYIQQDKISTWGDRAAFFLGLGAGGVVITLFGGLAALGTGVATLGIAPAAIAVILLAVGIYSHLRSVRLENELKSDTFNWEKPLPKQFLSP